MEIRHFDVKLDGQKQENGNLTVEGYVNKTESWSQPLGRQTRFVEQITKGTFKRAIDNAINSGQHIDFYAEHDPSKLLASTKNGSLELHEDATGLYMRANISKTSVGKDYHTMISEGLLTNMSFGFSINEDGEQWQKRDDGMYERTVNDINLAEVSVVKNPAYIESNIQARSIELVEAEPVFFMPENQNLNESVETNMEKMTEKEARELRAQLEEYEAEQEKRKEEKPAVKVEEVRAVETKKVDKSAEEIRAVKAFFSGDLQSPEVRALTAGSTPGSITIPTTISNNIIKKLFEVAPLFSMTRNFQNVVGNFEILKESDIGDANGSVGFVGEMDSSQAAGDFSMESVTLGQKRVLTWVELSQNLINQSELNVIDYATNILARRMALVLDREILQGTANAATPNTKRFAGLLNDSAIADIASETVGALKIDDIQLALNDMHPDYQVNAVILVNRKTFKNLVNLKDQFGRYYMVRDVVNDKITYKLFDTPVEISDAMPDVATGNRAVCVVDMNNAYTTATRRGLQFRLIDNDTTNVLAGKVTIALDGYFDGQVLNEAACRFVKIA